MTLNISPESKVGKIKITPYDAQVASNHLAPLQQAINNRWPTINLIDILKETDFRIGFTKYFPTVASRENINKTKFNTTSAYVAILS